MKYQKNVHYTCIDCINENENEKKKMRMKKNELSTSLFRRMEIQN